MHLSNGVLSYATAEFYGTCRVLHLQHRELKGQLFAMQTARFRVHNEFVRPRGPEDHNISQMTTKATQLKKRRTEKVNGDSGEDGENKLLRRTVTEDSASWKTRGNEEIMQLGKRLVEKGQPWRDKSSQLSMSPPGLSWM